MCERVRVRVPLHNAFIICVNKFQLHARDKIIIFVFFVSVLGFSPSLFRRQKNEPCDGTIVVGDVPAEVYDSIPGIDEHYESVLQSGADVPATSLFDIADDAEAVYVSIDGKPKPSEVDDEEQMRASRCFDTMKLRLAQRLKELELKLSLSGLPPLGETVGSALKLPSTSPASSNPLEEWLARLRLGNAEVSPDGPDVGKAAPSLPSVNFDAKIQPKKPPTAVASDDELQDVGRSVSAIGPSVKDGSPDDGVVGAAGPIVQPGSFFDDEEPEKPKKVTHTMTKQQLHDVKDIRDEINLAIKHHEYAHSNDEIHKIYESEHHPHHHHHHHHANGTHHHQQNGDSTNQHHDADGKHNHQQNDDTNQHHHGDGTHHHQHGDGEHSPKHHDGKKQPNESDVLPSWLVGSQRADFSFIPGEGDGNPSPAELPEPQSLANVTLSDADRHVEDVVEDMMAKKLATDEPTKIVANVVESHAQDAEDSETEQSIVNSDLREVLHIRAIAEDTRFNLGHTVVAWRTIQRNAHDKHALVGLTATGVILLVERNGTYVVQAEVATLTAPVCMTTYTRWNRTLSTIEGIVIVATQSELVFLRVNEQLDTMERYWIVPMNAYKVSAIEYFAINDAHMLVLAAADVTPPLANVYRFGLDHRELYLRESIALSVSASTVAFFTTGSENFLTFPQQDSAVVYKFTQDRFKFFVAIDAKNIETLEAFEMGGNTYLALGGARPRILRYFRGEFQDQTILAPSWGIVEHFLPIPARTYRDDLIVLIQHRIDFATHNISVLEALIWNGEAFDPVLSIPCYINGRKSEHGLGCMLDSERELGIEGATILQRNNFITILVPRHEAPSGLFDLEFELKPAEYEYDEAMLDLFAEILVMLDARAQQLTDARQTFDDFETSRDAEIVITDGTFDTIVTNYAEWDGEIEPTTKIFYGNEPTDAQTITNFIAVVNTMAASMNTEPPRSKRDDFDSNVVRVDSLNVSHLFVETINNVSINDFIAIENDSLDLNGTLVLQQPIDFNEVQLRGGESDPTAHDSELREEANEQSDEPIIERLDISGDIAFEEINGMAWQQLVDEIVLRNQPQDLTELIVNGVGFVIYSSLKTTHYSNSRGFGISGTDCRRGAQRTKFTEFVVPTRFPVER